MREMFNWEECRYSIFDKQNSNNQLWSFENIQIRRMRKRSYRKTAPQLNKYSLVNNLKEKIAGLKQVILNHEQTIEHYKRNTKVTLINEQEIHIQKLNDENRRLLLLIDEMQKGRKNSSIALKDYAINSKCKCRHRKSSLKKNSLNEGKLAKQRQNDQLVPRWENQQRYFQVLAENESLQKKLIKFKGHQNLFKKKSCMNDRNSILIEKNIKEEDKMRQKNYQLEAELAIRVEREAKLKKRVQELEELLEKALQINKSMKAIDFSKKMIV